MDAAYHEGHTTGMWTKSQEAAIASALNPGQWLDVSDAFGLDPVCVMDPAAVDTMDCDCRHSVVRELSRRDINTMEVYHILKMTGLDGVAAVVARTALRYPPMAVTENPPLLSLSKGSAV